MVTVTGLNSTPTIPTAGDIFYLVDDNGNASGNTTYALLGEHIEVGDGSITDDKRADVKATLLKRTINLANATTVTVGFATSDEQRDTGGWHSDTNNTRITVDEDGLYSIGVYGLFEASGGGDLRMLEVSINGSNTRQFRDAQSFDSSFAHTVSGHFHRDLSAGDYVELKAYQNSGSTLSTDFELQVVKEGN
ncbi:MAG: hypothetical protein WA991_03975 [Ornithinimicrobium sp.]